MINYSDEFLYVDKEVFKKIVETAGLTLIILIVCLGLFRWDDVVPFVLIGGINYIATYLIINYSRISNGNFIIIKIHLIFMIIHCLFISIGEESLLDKYIFFEASKYIDSSVYSTIVLHYIVNSFLKDTCNKKREILRYILIMGCVSTINYFNSINYFNKQILYMLIFMISAIILVIDSHKLKDKSFKNEKDVNIIRVLLLLVLIIDIINIFSYNNYVIYSINLIRLICTNLFLMIYVYKVNIINNGIRFKKWKNRNSDLESINKKLVEENKLLENKKTQLLERNRLYSEFLKLVTIPIVILNKKNKRIIYANDNFLELCEKSIPRDIINQNIESLLVFNERLEKKIVHKKNGHILAYRENYYINRILDINFVELNEYEMVLLINDITEKKNSDNLKRELERKKVDERMKSNFLSNISHDLKTPIGVIYSAIQLEEVYMENNNKNYIEKYNNICKDNCFYLTRLTNNLLDISRLSEESLKANMTKDNIVYFVEEKVNYLIEYARLNDINIVFDTENEEIFIHFDKELTERIIFNLLSNAIKYSKKSGEVKVNILNKDNKVLIQIIDNGIGMSEEFIGQAFKMYTMEKQNRNSDNKGTGIGLFVVYNLLKLQGGTIDIESELGEGSKFTLSFKKG